MERTVELVCLNHNKVAMVREDIISAIVLGYTTKEGITVQMTLVHKVCTHTGSRCLSMCSCKAKTLMCAHLMHQSHLDCNAFLGGISKNYGTNYILSDHSDFVV